MPAFARLLVANRGEIAVRILRTARERGYHAIAVYSEADADAPHVSAADTAVCIGGAAPAESYLSIPRLLEAARRTGAEAVHPGYGFLAEDPAFAEACAAAGLVWVGPPAAAMRVMGDKRLAKQCMEAAGVPLVPGYHGDAQDDAMLVAAAAEVGFPLMVKAAAGGGGRGLRRVETAAALPDALRAARSEARAGFGSDALLLERALAGVRHVEVQVFADAHGNVLHLGERDCSVQRRHQKLIEEAPSPAVDEALRARMGAAAVAAARAVDYRGAGTVEFLLDAADAFYFLEMNTRLQVEHPVTEAVTGLDLVAWQLSVAAGAPLPIAQEAVRFSGHAIEARLYAEDPAAGYLPQSGRIVAWQAPGGVGLRVDAGIVAGQTVGDAYDPLLAKLIAHGADRAEARRRLVAALERTVVLGLATNRLLLRRVLGEAAFVDGGVTTDWLEGEGGTVADGTVTDGTVAAAAADALAPARALAAALWCEVRGGWRRGPRPAFPALLHLRDEAGPWRAAAMARGQGRYHVRLPKDGAADTEHTLVLEMQPEGGVAYACDGQRHRATMAFDGRCLHLETPAHSLRVRAHDPGAGAGAGADGDGTVAAPLGGRVLAVRVQEGQQVQRGQCLLILEAMKLEHELAASAAGIVERIAVREGSQVTAGQPLIALSPAE